MGKPHKPRSPRVLNRWNFAIVAGSALLCIWALLLRSPGMDLAGVSPNWLLIWVIAWSVHHRPLQGAIAGVALGLIQDGLTAGGGETLLQPTHAIGLALAGFSASFLSQRRWLTVDMITVIMLVFAWAAGVEALLALQFSWLGDRPWAALWLHWQRVALGSAILSSLWTPVVYYPLHRWEQYLGARRMKR